MVSARVIVVGSLNLDLVYEVDELPRPGETVLGRRLREFSGGKGGNQAHAAARTAGPGVRVAMVACVGADPAGDRLRADLTAAGVDVTPVRSVPTTSGTALIAVDRRGENTIVVIPGANHAWPEDPLEGVGLNSADVVVTQGEVPFDVVSAVVAASARAGARCVVNAAPADRRILDLLDRVAVLVVNEGEFAELFGADGTEAGAVAAVAARLVPRLVVTLGGAGALLAGPAGAELVPAFPVDAIDTVGAGDAFVGGLASALAGGSDLRDAVLSGAAAGALTATIEGARHPDLTTDDVLRMRKSKV